MLRGRSEGDTDETLAVVASEVDTEETPRIAVCNSGGCIDEVGIIENEPVSEDISLKSS